MRQYIQTVSLLMVFLIITMPIAFAIDVQIVSVSGRDGVKDFRSAADKTILKVRVDPSGQDVTPSEVTIGPGTPIPMQSCVKNGNYYDCSFESSTNTLTSTSIIFRVLYKNLQTQPHTLYVDNAAPAVSVAALQSGENLEVEYGINDQPSGSCSGIRKATVKIDNSPANIN